MSDESISQKLAKVLEKTQELTIKLEKQLAYVDTLAETYKQNPCFSEDFEQGKNPPHEFWVGNGKRECYDLNGKFPHLYHTFNPQLNNISDMINYLIKECCCKNNKEKHQEDLKNLDNKLEDFQKKNEELQERNNKKQEDTCLKLDDLIKLLSKEKICITLEDLAHFLRGGENEEKQKQLIINPKGKEKIEETQTHIFPPRRLWS